VLWCLTPLPTIFQLHSKLINEGNANIKQHVPPEQVDNASTLTWFMRYIKH